MTSQVPTAMKAKEGSFWPIRSALSKKNEQQPSVGKKRIKGLIRVETY